MFRSPSARRPRRAPLWFLAALLAAGCAAKGTPPATGHEGEIALVCGEGVPEGAAVAVEKALAREVRFAGPEPLFHVIRVQPAEIAGACLRKNVLILTDLMVPGKTARAVRNALSPEQIGNASTHHGAIISLEDVWARGQSVVIVAAPDPEGVLSLAEERGQRIADVAASAVRGRLAESLYRDGEDTVGAGRLAQAAGWSLRIPKSAWRVDSSRQAEGFVRLVAGRPDRSVSVAWAPSPGGVLDEERGFAFFDSVAARFEEGGGLDRAQAQVSSGSFAGRASILISGARPQGASPAGGAFSGSVFLDPASSRIYAIGWRVAATSGEIRTWMWQMEALAGTFRATSDGYAKPG